MWGSSGEFFACFMPMSKTPARFIEIRVPGRERSDCQTDASRKILLCIFEKYGFQFRCKKANCYALVLRTSSTKMATIQSEYTFCWNSAQQMFYFIVTCLMKPRDTWIDSREGCCSGLKGTCVSLCHCVYHLNRFKETRLFPEGFLCFSIVLLIGSEAVRF